MYHILLFGLIWSPPPSRSLSSVSHFLRHFIFTSCPPVPHRICKKAKLELAQGNPSDQMALLKAIEGYTYVLEKGGRKQAEQFCDDKFVSRSTLLYLKVLTRVCIFMCMLCTLFVLLTRVCTFMCMLCTLFVLSQSS